MKWSEGGGLGVYRESEQSNGNILDLEGRLVTCQHGGRNLVRAATGGGEVEVVVDSAGGKRLNSPNDVAVRSDGSIWFTDPSYGLRGQPGELDGRFVFRLAPGAEEPEVVYRGFDMPNGVVFSPDEKRVYISDTGEVGKVRAFDAPAEGPLGEPVWEADVRSDGMCVDEMGNLYTTTGEGVQVFSPEGEKIGTIEVPEQPANACFGGDGYKTLFITARTSLYAVPMKVAGAKPKGAKW
jgi:gluconolactonase